MRLLLAVGLCLAQMGGLFKGMCQLVNMLTSTAFDHILTMDYDKMHKLPEQSQGTGKII